MTSKCPECFATCTGDHVIECGFCGTVTEMVDDPVLEELTDPKGKLDTIRMEYKKIPSKLDIIEELKAPKGKFRIMGVDRFEDPGEGHFHFGDYDTLDDALKIARGKTKANEADATDASVATVYYVYDDQGDYKGGDTWNNE